MAVTTARAMAPALRQRTRGPIKRDRRRLGIRSTPACLEAKGSDRCARGDVAVPRLVRRDRYVRAALRNSGIPQVADHLAIGEHPFDRPAVDCRSTGVLDADIS